MDDLLARFVERAGPGLIGFEMDRIGSAGGVDALHFAWAGGKSIDQPHYFRIEGPATLMELATPKATQPRPQPLAGTDQRLRC